MKKVAVVVPVKNEEKTIKALVESFDTILSAAGYSSFFVIVDDGSTDGTVKTLVDFKKYFPFLKIVVFDKNYGQHAAIMAGLDLTPPVDFVVLTDADLQNPPGQTLPMLSELDEVEAAIVYGVRDRVQFGNGFLSQFFWGTVYFFSLFKIPRNQTPLRVFNREFLLGFQKIKKRPAFLSAALALVPAKARTFPVETIPRLAGKSKYDLFKKIIHYWFYVTEVLLRRRRWPSYKVIQIYD